MSELAKEIGARLAASRKVEFNKACDFANKYDIPLSTYCQHETGKRALSVSALLDYSHWLGVDSGWLLTGSGLPYPNERETTAKQAALYQYLSERDQQHLFESEQQFLMQNNFAMVDVQLLKAVLREVFRCARQFKNVDDAAVLEFTIDTYNSVAQTSSALSDKIRMIELSVSSLTRGLESAERQADEAQDKTA